MDIIAKIEEEINDLRLEDKAEFSNNFTKVIKIMSCIKTLGEIRDKVDKMIGSLTDEVKNFKKPVIVKNEPVEITSPGFVGIKVNVPTVERIDFIPKDAKLYFVSDSNQFAIHLPTLGLISGNLIDIVPANDLEKNNNLRNKFHLICFNKKHYESDARIKCNYFHPGCDTDNYTILLNMFTNNSIICPDGIRNMNTMTSQRKGNEWLLLSQLLIHNIIVSHILVDTLPESYKEIWGCETLNC